MFAEIESMSNWFKQKETTRAWLDDSARRPAHCSIGLCIVWVLSRFTEHDPFRRSSPLLRCIEASGRGKPIEATAWATFGPCGAVVNRATWKWSRV